MQGGDDQAIEALRRGDIDAAGLDEPRRGLLEFVALLVKHAYKNTPDNVQQLRDLGWDDTQIAETVYVTGLFQFFNCVADAFGLVDPNYLQAAAEGRPGPKPAEKFD